jgi:hypothetical protein
MQKPECLKLVLHCHLERHPGSFRHRVNVARTRFTSQKRVHRFEVALGD